MGAADGVLTLYEIGAERAPTEKVLLRLSSYFGGLLCVAWSHDDRLLFTGGEDDLVSVCSVQRRAVVARGQDHRSWVISLYLLYISSISPLYLLYISLEVRAIAPG